jgi:hypothetical protein
MEKDNSLTPFEGKEIRKIWHDAQWYFSIIDVVEALTDSPQPSSYWNKVKKTILKENQSLRFWQRLKLKSADGKNYLTDCANTEGVLRIVMSVPSFKAEPFKLWLANIGKQFLDETENPELGIERLKEIYKAKGYDDAWIENRLKSIGIRKELTAEWKKRGIQEHQDYAILTAEIAKWTFGLTPTEHKNLKGLENQNLRDHMTNLELLFSAIGEEATRLYAIQEDAKGFNENYETAQTGGRAAGRALKALEADKKIKVVSSDNFLGLKGRDELPDEIDSNKIV